MSKKQRERKQRKLDQKRGGATHASWIDNPLSPQAQQVMAELAQLGPTGLESEMEQALMDSLRLHREPELENVSFEPSQVDKVLSRLLPRYDKKLEAARAKGQDEWDETYDELATEAIAELLPPERRKAILSSFDMMLQRLMLGTDTQTLKVAVLVRSALDDKSFPWGATALFGEMFEDAKAQARQRMDTAEQLMLEMLKPLGVAETVQDVQTLLDDPERLERLTESLVLTPEQQEQLDAMTGDILAEFEEELFAGHVALDLFTYPELEETAGRVNRLAELLPSLRAQAQPEYVEAIARVVQQRVVEIVTPDRLAEIRNELLQIGKEWLAGGNEDGRLLEMESWDLEEINPAESQFLYAALIGQMRRVHEQLGEYDPAVDATVIDAESNVSPVALDETQTQALRDRLGGMFKQQA